jgi:hypothetical protein
MYEFSKLLNETSNLNSKIISTGLIESKINEINEINSIRRNNQINKEELNYNGYMLEFSDNNNPLFQGALSSINVNEKYDKTTKINKVKGKNYLHSMDDKIPKNIYNSMNVINLHNNSIQLTKKVKAPNLYSYFHEPQKNVEKNEDDNNNGNNNENNNEYNFEEYEIDKSQVNIHRLNR